MDVARIVLYIILGLPTAIFVGLVGVVGFGKKRMPSGWLSVTTGALVILLFGYALFDTGHISRFVVNVAGQTYYISSNALQEVILKNIDNLGMALGKVYEEFYTVEVFDLTKESESVKWAEKDGNIYVKSKLKYRPVLNTIQWSYSGGWQYSPSPDEKPFIDKDLFMWTKVMNANSIDEVKNEMKEANLTAEIRYLRKE